MIGEANLKRRRNSGTKKTPLLLRVHLGGARRCAAATDVYHDAFLPPKPGRSNMRIVLATCHSTPLADQSPTRSAFSGTIPSRSHASRHCRRASARFNQPALAHRGLHSTQSMSGNSPEIWQRFVDSPCRWTASNHGSGNAASRRCGRFKPLCQALRSSLAYDSTFDHIVEEAFRAFL